MCFCDDIAREWGGGLLYTSRILLVFVVDWDDMNRFGGGVGGWEGVTWVN